MFKRLLNSNLQQASTDLAILLLRVFSGAFIMTHGVPKLMKVANGDLGFGDPIGLGPELSLILTAFAEGICGFLVLVGLGTRWATLPLIIVMAVAAFIHHATDPFGGKEKALLFLVIFITLLITGSGKYSLDKKLLNH